MVKAADDHDRRPQLPPTAFLAERARSQRDLGDALIQLLQSPMRTVLFSALRQESAFHGSSLGVYYT